MLTEPDMRNALNIVLWELIKLLSDFIRGDRKKVTGGIIRNKDRSFGHNQSGYYLREFTYLYSNSNNLLIATY